MPFSGMIKFKLLRIKITKKYILFFLHFRIKKKRKKEKKGKKITRHKNISTVRRKKKKKKKKKEKIIRKLIEIAIGILHISHLLGFIICRLCIYTYII